MTAYDATAWHDLFVASAGAAAALAGLVFVAVSINIEAILALKGVPERGLHTVLLLVGGLVASIFVLVPQGTDALGIELIVVGATLVAWFAFTSKALLAGTQGRAGWGASRLLVVIPGSVSYDVAGVSLLTHGGGGLVWVLAGVLGAFVGGVVNAWVLLVEILR